MSSDCRKCRRDLRPSIPDDGSAARWWARPRLSVSGEKGNGCFEELRQATLCLMGQRGGFRYTCRQVGGSNLQGDQEWAAKAACLDCTVAPDLLSQTLAANMRCVTPFAARFPVVAVTLATV